MKRYNSIAVSLHWLIAVMIVGLIIIAKISDSLAEDDPLRFELIQWHKSFGIAVLLLVFFRIVWRLLYKPPPLPENINALERLAAAAAHLGLYALMIAMPLTGWAMVSASPLDLATELFGLIPWPHLPVLSEVADKTQWEQRFRDYHHLLAKGLILLVVLHVLAALRHQFVLKDSVMTRMSIAGSGSHGLLFGVLIAVAGVIGLTNLTDQQRTLSVTADESTQSGVGIQASSVEFVAMQMGNPVVGVFQNHQISLQLDDANLTAAKLSAVVTTASVNTGDGQIDDTVVTANWFASDTYPQATFESNSITSADSIEYQVSGTLTIRDIAKSLEFTMQREAQTFRGEFTVDRTDFGIGVGGQDQFVDVGVSIRFVVSNKN